MEVGDKVWLKAEVAELADESHCLLSVCLRLEAGGTLWCAKSDISAQPGLSEGQVCDKPLHLYVWTRTPMFYAVAQASNVAEARALLLEEIGTSGDGSCPEREAADKWVRENQPAIWHKANAEFALTDSAELRENELLVESLQKQITALKLAASQASPMERAADAVFTPILVCEKCGNGPLICEVCKGQASPQPHAGSLLKEPSKEFVGPEQGCYCTDKCMAPVVMGRQMPCLRKDTQPPAT